MVGLLDVGFVANLLMRPVAENHHVPCEPMTPYPHDLEDASACRMQLPCRAVSRPSTSFRVIRRGTRNPPRRPERRAATLVR
jgi:hypothetical protein